MARTLVSVCLITYNHAPFIRQAIESVLMQQTNFPWELVIADDCSTDGTRDILIEYQKKYPDIIRLLLREKNMGPARNFIDLISTPKSDLISYFEGDDYWTDPLKLQKQADILRSYQDVAISSHNTVKLVPNGNMVLYSNARKFTGPNSKNLFGIEDYIVQAFFHSSSIMYKRAELPELPPWYKDAFGGDYFLVLLLTMNGKKIHYVNENRTVYRINSQSISHFSTRIEILHNYLQHFEHFDEYSGYKYHKYLEGMKFSLLFGRYYYYPSYFRKVWFALRNMRKIFNIHPSVISRMGRWKIFIPTYFLRSKVDLYKKNTA